MRTTIACERRSKVKCKHEGEPPCRGCQRSGKEASCLLSGPVLRQGPKAVSSPTARGSKRKRPPQEEQRYGHRAPVRGSRLELSEEDVKRFFEAIPHDHVAKAMTVFQVQFPEFGFLHPDDNDRTSGPLSTLKMLRLLAIFAVSSRYVDDITTPTGSECASLLTRELKDRVTSSQGIDLVQTYLIMALYEWGEGQGFSAWMYAGIAGRMAHGVIAIPSTARPGKPLSELEKRTLWTCFSVDKLLSCGRQRRAMFKLEEMNIPPPLSDDDFVFCSGRTVAPPNGVSQPQLGAAGQELWGIGDAFHIILRGLDVWSKIHTWTVEGGRKVPGMTEPANYPWRKDSVWGRMKCELLRWRQSQDPRLKYPETRVSVHVHLRRGELFGYINLIYYISLIFLCREYIPFLPVGETGPRGPIDPPLLTDLAPDSNFWVQNRDELFDAAAQISDLMKDLRHAGAPIYTPFTGLCAFTSTLMHFYAEAFPSFAGQHASASARARAGENIEYLKRICVLWRVGEEWLDVLETGKNLFSRVNSTRLEQAIERQSRENYPELEESINLASLGGMPPLGTGQHSSQPDVQMVVEEQETVHDEAVLHPQQLLGDEAPPFPFGSEGMDEQEWRLWSFWDDPHLLPIINGNEFV